MILVHCLNIGWPMFTVRLLEELGLNYERDAFDHIPETRRGPKNNLVAPRLLP